MRKYIAAALCCLALCALVFPALADNSAPVAENFEFETYRGVSFGGKLCAVDPDGDAVSFEITTQPKKGTIELSDDGSFVDMDGSASYCSAVRLAECGAFVGKQIGGEYYFEPQKTLSRGEFVAMCLCVTGTDVLRGVVSTGFADDGSIPDWQRAYVASAGRDGVVKGKSGAVFDAEAEISRAEAGVMLDRLLSLTNVSCENSGWAAQSAANLDACGIMDSENVDSAALTHAEAADMLAAAMNVLENR